MARARILAVAIEGSDDEVRSALRELAEQIGGEFHHGGTEQSASVAAERKEVLKSNEAPAARGLAFVPGRSLKLRVMDVLRSGPASVKTIAQFAKADEAEVVRVLHDDAAFELGRDDGLWRLEGEQELGPGTGDRDGSASQASAANGSQKKTDVGSSSGGLSTRERILEMARTLEGGFRARQVADAGITNAPSAAVWLATMCKRGELRRIGEGLYAAAGGGGTGCLPSTVE